MVRKLFSFLVAAVLVSGSVGMVESVRAEEKKDLTRSEKRLARLHEKYEPTGETRNCVSLMRLNESIIIDDQTIFFRSNSKTAYVNRLPRRCPRLAVEERFAYSTSIGQLCRLEIITVLDSFGQSWNRCSLGSFEEWKKKPTDKDGDETTENPADADELP